MGSWWHRDVIAAGRLPLGLCLLAFVLTFASTRTITRLIRDGRGPFRNITASGTHVHHAVPGLILLIVGALTAIGGPGSLGWLAFAAVTVGIGMSLVLDEFALILRRAGSGPGGQPRPAAGPVRPPDRLVPGRQAQVRGHAGRAGGCPGRAGRCAGGGRGAGRAIPASPRWWPPCNAQPPTRTSPRRPSRCSAGPASPGSTRRTCTSAGPHLRGPARHRSPAPHRAR